MTFLSPWRLTLVVAPIALAVAYVLMQRLRHRYAVRFTSVDLLRSVAPERPGWQRHVAPALLAVALTVLVVGYARPAHAVREPRQRATVILALDTSGSMGSTDVSPTRLAAAESAARKFVGGLPAGLQVGLISFDDKARVLVAPTADHATVLSAIDRLQLAGGTATGDAISLALDTISSQPSGAGGKPVPAAVVLMSDGTPTVGQGDQSPAEAVAAASSAAKQAGVPVNTIAFGTPEGTVNTQGRQIPVPSDPDAMAQIASDTNGKTFTASSATQLGSVYKQIGRLVGYDTVTKELAVPFTGVAIALLILSSAGALWWAQRMV
jgi:Ca-activated chloride channel family protein